MSEVDRLRKQMSILYEALQVAREGLKILSENPVAAKTLKEIDKTTNKVLEV